MDPGLSLAPWGNKLFLNEGERSGSDAAARPIRLGAPVEVAMAKENKKKNESRLDLATTVKVDSSVRRLGFGQKALKQSWTAISQRILPSKRPSSGVAYNTPAKSPNPARKAPMAYDKLSQAKFKKFRFAVVFALVLGLAAAGGYSFVNAISRSFHKVSDVFDYKRWVKLAGGHSKRDGHSPSESRNQSYAGSQSSSRFSSGRDDSSQRSFTRSYPQGHKSYRSFSQRGGGKRLKKVRDPFYKVHNPMSKKHVQKHRKWSKKLAKIKKSSTQKYHKASFRTKRQRASVR